jgi:hypothetical protein
MGGERLDTRNPTSKLMLTILAGVATCLLDASPQFLRRAGASHDGADRFSERHRVASMGVTAIMRVQGVGRKAKSAVGARKNRSGAFASSAKPGYRANAGAGPCRPFSSQRARLQD